MPNSSQRRLGYRDVVFNIKDGSFYQPVAGDNYEALNVSLAGGDEDSSAQQVSADQVILPNGTGEFGLTDPPGGIATQADFNTYIYGAVPTLTSELTNDSGFITMADMTPHFSGDYNDLTNTPEVYTKTESDANYAAKTDVYTKAEADDLFAPSAIENLTHLEDFDEDDDYFSLRTSMATNFARVGQ